MYGTGFQAVIQYTKDAKMRFSEEPRRPGESITLHFSHAECGMLLGLLDVATGHGIDLSGIADRVRIAWDASGLPGSASHNPVPAFTPSHVRPSLTEELIGGPVATALSER